MDTKTEMRTGKCPVVHGTTNLGMRSNSDWWPNQLNLKILHQNSPLVQSDGRGVRLRGRVQEPRLRGA